MDSPNNTPERSEQEYEEEIAALKERVKWLSCQRYGRILPGLLAFPAPTHGDEEAHDEADRAGRESESIGVPAAVSAKPDRGGVLREDSAPYRISGGRKPESGAGDEDGRTEPVKPSAVTPDRLPEEETTLELPPRERAGMTVVGFEDCEAMAARPAVVRRRIRRSMYASMDGSGLAAAAPAPALFDDPSGGPVRFDASFAAWVAALRVAGRSYRAIASRLRDEEGLEVGEETLRGLFLAVAETVAPVCSALFLRTLPDWDNLRRMFEESGGAGDWMAEEFLGKIHALTVLEENALARAERLGGAPEDLYRERRAARAQALRITTEFFRRCRELEPTLDPGSPLAETLRYAVEHETVLSEYLYDPRVEMTAAKPDGFRPNPLAELEICAAECERRGVFFRAWLEHAIVMLKQTPPPPPETLFPHG